MGRTLTGIIGFGVLYLLLIAFGLALGYACVAGAIGLVTMSVNKFTIVLGLGLLALAIMFFSFLVKFLFVVHKNESAQRIEITASDHPRLFAFIDKLTDEVNSPKPYKIYLAPNVNACVFYNSSFWSLFFPVRKNLEIGLGLVNSINLSEFKAVMAHEFGHFSQRSMKLGSYVYVVNRVIYNLVYERDKWDNLLDRWAALGGLWGFFAGITHWLVKIVRSILEKAYQWLNLRYMGLSREMEYQADLVAVSAAGCQPTITALRRIELGHVAYTRTIDHLNRMIGESKVAHNLYPLQIAMIEKLAHELEFELANGLPTIGDEQVGKLIAPNRVNFQDQWSSHPAQTEREANINNVSVTCLPDESSPWSLFDNPQAWQQMLTERLYVGVELPEGGKKQFVGPPEFADYVQQQEQRAQLPAQYNGFYDHRLLNDFDSAEQAASTAPIPAAELLFSDQSRATIKRLFTNYEDRSTLEQIKSKAIQTRSFDFDGRKYDRRAVDNALETINAEIETEQTAFRQLEKDAFRWHHARAVERGRAEELIQRYQLYFQLDANREKYGNLFSEYGQLLQQTYEAVKDGGVIKPKLGAQFETFYEELQDAYAHSQTIRIPEQIGEHQFANGYAAFLCPEKLQPLDEKPFDFEKMVTLYQQLEQIPSRAAQVQVAQLDELIRWQATL
ncbi:M48 family metallopeptidase [Larkinella insperata]|uniref:M48 family metallopeptidase n=1 Tax=Larkinella insperata TaxID=332158 RepID=A0ABW3QEL4_9BACT